MDADEMKIKFHSVLRRIYGFMGPKKKLFDFFFQLFYV